MKSDFCFIFFICILGLSKSQIPNSLIKILPYIHNLKQSNSFDVQLLYHRAKSFSLDLKNFQLNKISLSDSCSTDIQAVINGLWSKQEWSINSKNLII